MNKFPTATKLIRLFSPMSNASYLAWRETQLVGVQSTTATRGKGRRGTTESLLPSQIAEALLADTTALRAAGWNQPPGTTYVNYIRSAHSFGTSPLPVAPAASRARPSAARRRQSGVATNR